MLRNWERANGRICQSITPTAVREVRDDHTAGMYEQPQEHAGETHQS